MNYDNAGRFIGRSQVGTNKPYSQFIYDKNGNRIRGYEDEKTFEAEYDNQDRLIRYNKSTYGYNINGALQWKLEGSDYTNYFYNSFGNLTEVHTPSRQIQYLYDGHHRRVARKEWGNITTRYIWENQLRLAAELNADGTLRKQFIYADSKNSPEYMFYANKKYLFVKDYRGSILKVIDASSGEIMQEMSYSEFGQILQDTNPGFQPFGFAGGIYDIDSRLILFGARDYDPSIGRWLSKDPIMFEGGDTNLYGYVLQDPINGIDPDGLQTVPIGGGQAAGAAGVMASGYLRMLLENRKGSDKFYHCQSSCKAARIGPAGAEMAGAIGDLREANDKVRKGDSDKECAADQAANKAGRDAGSAGGNCEKICRSLFPY